jgi:uncharacterized membrane protein
VPLKKPDFLLLFIIAVGTALRFYGFPDIPFMYDEVSAWGRTGFSSFSELIQKGVKGDGHPAGIQVFLNYWRMLVGDTEAAFKFPFLIMGLLSIWLVFRIGKFWFNETVGYLSAALIASLQYTVMYSQIARPYMSGLFFSLMMVWCWTNYLFNSEEKHKVRQLMGFVVFAVLCCYNHYFSLLFAFITGVTGLFFLEKDNKKQYLIANVMVVLLFLPHLSITIFQLGIGGVGGWLPKPGPDFFGNYIDFIFQFSWWMKGLVLAIIFAGFIVQTDKVKPQFRFRVISLIWFLLPFFIGYFYSVYCNAVLQYSVLIFTFPFLLFFIFSSIKALPSLFNWLLVTLVLATGIYGLVVERKHYTVFYHQPIQELVKNTLSTTDAYHGKTTTILMNQPKKYVGYYLHKYDSDLKMDYWSEKDFQSYIAFRKYLESLKTDLFIAANLRTDYLILVKQFFPYEVARAKGFTYLYKAFSKTDLNSKFPTDVVFRESLRMNTSTKSSYFTFDSSYVETDSTSRLPRFHFSPTNEFGPAFKCALLPVMTNGYNVVNITMKVKEIKKDNLASIVVSFDKAGESVFWQEKPFSYFIDSTESEGTVFYSISLRDLGFKITDQHTLSAYIWNKSNDDFYLSEFELSIDEGNPVIYGLIEPL